MESNVKKCSKCQEYLTFDKFYKDSTKKYGIGSKCKKCDDHRRDGRRRKELDLSFIDKQIKINSQNLSTTYVSLQREKVKLQELHEKVQELEKLVDYYGKYEIELLEMRDNQIIEKEKFEELKQIELSKKYEKENKERRIKIQEQLKVIEERKSIVCENEEERRIKRNRDGYERRKLRMLMNEEYRKKLNKKKELRSQRREKKDGVYKLKRRIRSSLRDAFYRKGYGKNTKSADILGIDYEGLKKHFESLFTEGMSWENMGTWHIDHIIPLSTAETEEDVIKLCHYTNLQPLWGDDNLKKGNKIL